MNRTTPHSRSQLQLTTPSPIPPPNPLTTSRTLARLQGSVTRPTAASLGKSRTVTSLSRHNPPSTLRSSPKPSSPHPTQSHALTARPKNTGSIAPKGSFTVEDLNNYFKSQGIDKPIEQKSAPLTQGCYISVEALTLTVEEITRLPSLPPIHTLELSSCWIEDAQLIALINRLKGTLRGLHLDFCFGITPEVFKVLPPLELLYIGHHPNLTDASLEYLVTSKETLKKLSCSRTQITSQGIQWIAHNFKRLTALNLSFCSYIKDADFLPLKALSELQNLNVEGCQIDPTTLRNLSHVKIIQHVSFRLTPAHPKPLSTRSLTTRSVTDLPDSEESDEERHAFDLTDDEMAQITQIYQKTSFRDHSSHLNFQAMQQHFSQGLEISASTASSLSNSPKERVPSPADNEDSNSWVSTDITSNFQDFEDLDPHEFKTEAMSRERQDSVYNPGLTHAPSYENSRSSPTDHVDVHPSSSYEPTPEDSPTSSNSSSLTVPARQHRSDSLIHNPVLSLSPSYLDPRSVRQVDRPPLNFIIANQTPPLANPQPLQNQTIETLKQFPTLHAFAQEQGITSETSPIFDKILEALQKKNTQIRDQNRGQLSATRTLETGVINVQNLYSLSHIEHELKRLETVMILMKMRPVLQQFWPVWIKTYEKTVGTPLKQYRNFEAILDQNLEEAIKWISQTPLVFNQTTKMSFENLGLTTIPDCIAQMPLYTLEYLSFDGNLISFLPSQFFQKSLELKIFSITENSLQSIPSNLTETWINIEFLNFAGNQITAIPDRLCEGCENVKSLIFRSNAISDIPERFLNTLKKLSRRKLGIFDVSHNHLKEASLRALKEIVGLEESSEL